VECPGPADRRRELYEESEDEEGRSRKSPRRARTRPRSVWPMEVSSIAAMTAGDAQSEDPGQPRP